jgi:hypothetical protein
VTGVTNQQDRNSAELSASGGQLLRELTERARAGGLTLTGEGGVAGRITPGRQSGLGVNAGAGLGGPPPGVPHARLGGRGVIAEAGGMDAG